MFPLNNLARKELMLIRRCVRFTQLQHTRDYNTQSLKLYTPHESKTQEKNWNDL